MVECPPQIDGERLVRLLVEAEVLRRAGFVPPRVVVVASSLVQSDLHIEVWADEFGGVDHTALEGGEDLAAGNEHRRGTRPCVDLAAKVWNAHPETLEVADRADLLSEPAAHLRSIRHGGTRHDVKGSIRLLHQLEPVSLVQPGGGKIGR